MPRFVGLVVAWASVAAGTKLSSFDQGAKFDKCIKISDWESKTLEDDIELSDRDANGCCPDDTVPGVKHYNNYVGAQVICGFKSDGTVAVSTGSSNGVKTCTYNQCYVMKQNLECSSGRQFLNGCCAAPADCSSNSCGFKASTCKNYAYSMKNVYNDASEYCLTYNQNYKMEHTADKSDDQKDDKLQVDKLYVYTPCAALGDGSSGSGGSTTGGIPNASWAKKSAVASGLLVFAGIAGASLSIFG